MRWPLLGMMELCGKSCWGEYCKVQNARLAKGSKGTFFCQGCGVAVKTPLARCNSCGAARHRLQIWRENQRILRAEFQRLAAIEIS